MASSTHAQEDQENAYTFASTADAGASLTYPLQSSALRKGGYVLIKGHPCKISEISKSAPGKHGHAKIHVEGYDVCFSIILTFQFDSVSFIFIEAWRWCLD